MEIELDTVLIITVAMAIGSFVKGATGQGLPQIAIPVMATFLGVEAAVVIMAIPGVVSNTWLLWNYRRYYERTRDLPAILIAGTAGAVAGTVLLDNLDADVLSLSLAGMIVLYVVVFFSHPELQLTPTLTRFASPPLGLAAGVLQGATGVSGPLLATYLHGYRMEKEVYVLSISTIFQVYAVVQVATLSGLGLFTRDRFVLSVLSLLPIMVLLRVGARFTERLSRRRFDLVVLTVLLASAVKLVYDGLT